MINKNLNNMLMDPTKKVDQTMLISRVGEPNQKARKSVHSMTIDVGYLVKERSVMVSIIKPMVNRLMKP